MGLAFSHGTANWSYGGFHSFRQRLAREIGLDLDRMRGFTDKPDSQPWEVVGDAIVPLLNHSDCEGSIACALLPKLADRLEELVQDWPMEWWEQGGYDREHALLLVEGMREAAAAGEDLEFH